MPTNRVTMRRIRETLRLHLQAGLSYGEVARALKIAKCVFRKSVTGDFGIVTDDFGNVTGDFGAVTDGHSGVS